MLYIATFFFGFCEKLDKTFSPRGQKFCKTFTKSQRFLVPVDGGSGRPWTPFTASWSRRGYVLSASGPLVESV